MVQTEGPRGLSKFHEIIHFFGGSRGCHSRVWRQSLAGAESFDRERDLPFENGYGSVPETVSDNPALLSKLAIS
jgi:hypothetical protein